MNLTKREFLQVLTAASAAGMGLGRYAHASTDSAAKGLYDIPKFGNVSFLHITDCHAQLKPIYFREPSVNLGLGDMQGRLPQTPARPDAADRGALRHRPERRARRG